MPPQTITNTRDQSRIFPTSAISDANMLESEGTAFEKITGPGADAEVELSSPASEILHVQSFVTATGIWHTKPNLAEGTDYSVTLKNANGVASLLELLSASQAVRTWIVWYRRDKPDATPGNQSVAIPGSGI